MPKPSDLHLSVEEQRVLDALADEAPEFAEAFVEALPEARRTVLEALLDAVLREGLVESEDVLRTSEILAIALPGRRSLVAPIRKPAPGSPFELRGPVRLAGHADAQALLTDPEAVWALLCDGLPELSPEARAARHVGAALSNATANEALARLGRRRSPQGRGLARWARLAEPLPPAHPLARLMVGFCARSYREASPSWSARPRLLLAAVAKEACRVTRLDAAVGPGELLESRHPGLLAAAGRALSARGAHPANYELLPMHPWQAERLLPRLQGRALLWLPELALEAASLESPHHLLVEGGAYALELPLAVWGAEPMPGRPERFAERVALSRLMRALCRRPDAPGAERFEVLEVPAAMQAAFGPSGSEERFEAATCLGALWRESPEARLKPGEIVVPAGALASMPPGEAPPVLTWVACCGSPLAFFRRYVELVVPPLLSTLARWGVALPGGPESGTLVFDDDGLPVRYQVSDLLRARVWEPRLRRAGLASGLPPSSPMRARSAGELWQVTLSPLLEAHLGGLIRTLARATGAEPEGLWHEAARAFERALAALEGAIDPADRAACFAPTLPVEGHLRRHLSAVLPEGGPPLAVPNPLAPFRPYPESR